MHIIPIRTRRFSPPKDDIYPTLKKLALRLREGDVVAITSKVISIHEGRCVYADQNKDTLAISEAQWYLPRSWVPGAHAMHTITQGVLIRSSGIDASNADNHLILWPKNPYQSAARLLAYVRRESKIEKLGVVITDSTSTPLRRGTVGIALAYAGFQPLNDYRGKEDLFGRDLTITQANIADGIAAAAVLSMGEGVERTPVAIVRGAPCSFSMRKNKKPFSTFLVPMQEDLFAPFFTKLPWRLGGKS